MVLDVVVCQIHVQSEVLHSVEEPYDQRLFLRGEAVVTELELSEVASRSQQRSEAGKGVICQVVVAQVHFLKFDHAACKSLLSQKDMCAVIGAHLAPLQVQPLYT